MGANTSCAGPGLFAQRPATLLGRPYLTRNGLNKPFCARPPAAPFKTGPARPLKSKEDLYDRKEVKNMATTKQIEANRRNSKKSTGPKTPAGKAKVSSNAVTHGLLAQGVLLPDEDAEAFLVFADDLLADLKPDGAVERLLAEQIVDLGWRLRRLRRIEAGLIVREEAVADQEWLRREAETLEFRERDIALDRLLMQHGITPPDMLVAVSQPERYVELLELADEAADRRRSDLARLGEVFVQDAVGGDAFSKVNRYETAIARRLSRTLDEFREAQQARRERA